MELRAASTGVATLLWCRRTYYRAVTERAWSEISGSTSSHTLQNIIMQLRKVRTMLLMAPIVCRCCMMRLAFAIEPPWFVALDVY